MEYHGVIDKLILLKFTSRGRPNELMKCIKEYLRLANNPSRIVWLFTFDIDDDKYNSVGFCDSIAHLIDNPNIVFGSSKNKIYAINRDMETIDKAEIDWHILVSASDDQTPIVQGWDSIIRDAMPNDLDASLWFNDGAQPRINTMEIQGHTYFNRLGYIYNPAYKSFYCDNEATDVAQKLGKLIKSDQCIIRHDHPACKHPTSIKHDSLYDRNQLAWDEDKATFLRYQNGL